MGIFQQINGEFFQVLVSFGMDDKIYMDITGIRSFGINGLDLASELLFDLFRQIIRQGLIFFIPHMDYRRRCGVIMLGENTVNQNNDQGGYDTDQIQTGTNGKSDSSPAQAG